MDAPAVKPIPKIDKRTITPAEVMEWSAHGRKPWPSEACDEIASRLTKMRWPGDPDTPYMPRSPSWPKGWDPPPSDPAAIDPWWDPKKAAIAAKALRDDIPAMLWHWHWMQWTPAETRPGQKPMRLRGGYEAIEQFRIALNAALPYIEWPFGKYERQDHRKKSRPSNWHMYAVVIAGIISRALVQSGRRRAPSFARDSAAARAVYEALSRMGHPYVDANTIATHLIRRADKLRKTT
ncbi:MAG TPA: hypothetical protein VII24_06650 [Pseudolabrys sp.]